MDNIYTRFKKLVISEKVRVGEVLSIDGNRSLLQTYDGDKFYAEGNSVAVGQLAITVNGIIRKQTVDYSDKDDIYIP